MADRKDRPVARLVSIATALTVGIAVPAAADTPLLPAPFQVEAVVQYRTDADREGDGLSFSPPLIAVDLGHADNRVHPGTETNAEMTLLGIAGSAQGRLSDIQKSCDFLCGDNEGEECHYRALYELDQPLDALGSLLVGIPGTHDIEGLHRLGPATGGDVPVIESATLAPPAWSPYASERPAYRVARWTAEDATLVLETRYGGGEISAFEDNRCRASAFGPLTRVSCSSLSLLMAGDRLLLLSFPDYNVPSAEPLASFTSGGRTYYLVRLGLKAQTVLGLVVNTPDGWQALFAPRDYALIC